MDACPSFENDTNLGGLEKGANEFKNLDSTYIQSIDLLLTMSAKSGTSFGLFLSCRNFTIASLLKNRYSFKRCFGLKANFDNLFVFCKYALLVLKSMT